MRVTKALCCIMISCVLTGCSLLGGENVDNQALGDEISTLNISSDCSYDRTPQTSHICIDNQGYLPTSKKVFYIQNPQVDNLHKEYSILDADSDEPIYSGNLVMVKEATGDAGALYMGDFSMLADAGAYRIYQPDVGYSDSFTVDKNVYRKLFDASNSKLKTYTYVENADCIYPMTMMMLTEEIYGTGKIDYDYIQKQINYLLTQQDKKTGGVYGEYMSEDNLNKLINDSKQKGTAFDASTYLSLTTTALTAGVIAQFCADNNTGNINVPQYISAANRAYVYIERYRDNVDPDAWYYASAELYRATGGYKYRNAIAEYDTIGSIEKESEPDYTLVADVAYLKTNYKIDYDRCQAIWDKYVDRAGEISSKSGKESYYVQNDIETLEKADILNNMIELGLVSYVLSGNEYGSIENNYIHYLGGNNPDRADYFAHDFEESDIQSKMLFVLASGMVE